MNVWGKLLHVGSGLRRACLPTRRRRRWHRGNGSSESLESRRLLSASPVLENVAILQQTETGLQMGGIATWGTEAHQGVEVYFDFGGDGSSEASLRMDGAGGRFSQSVPTEGISGTVDLYVRAEFCDMSLGQQTTRWKIVTVVLPAAGQGMGHAGGPGSTGGGSESPGDRMVGRGRIDDGSGHGRTDPGQRDGIWNPPVQRFRDTFRDREDPIGADDASVDGRSWRDTPLGVPVFRDRGPVAEDSVSSGEQDKAPDADADRPYFSNLEVKLMGTNSISCRGRVQSANNNTATVRLGGAIGQQTLTTDAMGNFFGMFRWTDRTLNFVTLIAVDCNGEQSALRLVDFA